MSSVFPQPSLLNPHSHSGGESEERRQEADESHSKESHIMTFFNLLVLSGIPIASNVKNIPELDYCSHFTIELWEKSTSSNANSGGSVSGASGPAGRKDFSLRLSVSEGAHSPAVLDSNVDAVSSHLHAQSPLSSDRDEMDGN